MATVMDELSKNLVYMFHEATTFCSHVLETTGIDKPFHAAADVVYDYPINTLLLSVHFITLVYKMRTLEGIYFSSSNPFGSLFSCVILSFAGSTLQNILLGLPPVLAFEKTYLILIICLVWYLIFFCPVDLFTRLVTFLPVRVVLICLKEVYRTKCILSGVQIAFTKFPESWFIIIAIGCVRGCGSVVLKPFVHQVVGLGQVHAEFHRPSFTTKLVILTSCFYVLQLKKIIDVSLASSSFIFTVVFALFHVLFLYSSQNDPFAPLENAFASIFLRHSEERATTNESKKKSD